MRLQVLLAAFFARYGFHCTNNQYQSTQERASTNGEIKYVVAGRTTDVVYHLVKTRQPDRMFTEFNVSQDKEELCQSNFQKHIERF